MATNPIAQITDFHDDQSAATCLWCGKGGRECVQVSFAAGLIRAAVLCMPCLTNALRVATRTDASSAVPSSRTNG